jgi:hypothetical protein
MAKGLLFSWCSECLNYLNFMDSIKPKLNRNTHISIYIKLGHIGWNNIQNILPGNE